MKLTRASLEGAARRMARVSLDTGGAAAAPTISCTNLLVRLL